MIPEPLALKCRDTFKLAVGYALADLQSSATLDNDKLWCVHVTGADDVHPMPSFSEALHEANKLNSFLICHQHQEGDPIMIAVATEWPHSPESHAAGVAIRAEAIRMRNVPAAPKQAAADLAPSAAVRAIRDYLSVHDGIKLGGHAMDDMALDIARVVLNSETVKKAKRYDWITRQAWVRREAQIRLKLSARCEYDRPLYDHELAKAIDTVMRAEQDWEAATLTVAGSYDSIEIVAAEPVFSLVPSFRHADIRIDCVMQPGEGYGWFVRRFGEVLNKQGQWEHEPQPSNRDAAFYERSLFETPTDAIIAAKAATRSANALPS